MFTCGRTWAGSSANPLPMRVPQSSSAAVRCTHILGERPAVHRGEEWVVLNVFLRRRERCGLRFLRTRDDLSDTLFGRGRAIAGWRPCVGGRGPYRSGGERLRRSGRRLARNPAGCIPCAQRERPIACLGALSPHWDLRAAIESRKSLHQRLWTHQYSRDIAAGHTEASKSNRVTTGPESTQG